MFGSIACGACGCEGVVFCKSIHRLVDRDFASASDSRTRSWKLCQDQQAVWRVIWPPDTLVASGMADCLTELRIGWTHPGIRLLHP